MSIDHGVLHRDSSLAHNEAVFKGAMISRDGREGAPSKADRWAITLSRMTMKETYSAGPNIANKEL